MRRRWAAMWESDVHGGERRATPALQDDLYALWSGIPLGEAENVAGVLLNGFVPTRRVLAQDHVRDGPERGFDEVELMYAIKIGRG